MKKVWCKHKIEYSSAFKKEGNVAICNNMDDLKDTVLHDISQSQKDKYCLNPHACSIYISQSRRNRVEWWLPGTAGERNGGLLCSTYKVSFLLDEWVLELCCATL